MMRKFCDWKIKHNDVKREVSLAFPLLSTKYVVVSLKIFYFNLVRCTYKYIQVTECKRIRTKDGSLCYSSPSNNQM